MSKNKRQKLDNSSDSDEASKFADAVDPVLQAKMYGASSNGTTLT